MVTIYDIARECGLAPSTVSKALNRYKGVNQATLEKVTACAKRMGYIPNATAHNLITKRSHNIGVVIDIPNVVGLNHNLFMSVLNGFKSTLEHERYDITLMSKRLYEGGYLSHCLTRGFDGVLILGDFSSEQVQEVICSSLPVVCLDYHGDKAIGVHSNNYDCTVKLTQYLLELGHTNIAYIKGEYNYVTERRRDAFVDAMNRADLDGEAAVIDGCYYLIGRMYDTVKTLLREHPETTAIMFPDDHSAMGGINAIVSSGRSIPEDISITGYDGIELGQIIKPRLTTVKQNADALGAKLAERLMAQIAGRDSSVRSETVEAELLIGDSTAQVRKS